MCITVCKLRAGSVRPAVATTDCSQHTVKLEGDATVTQLNGVVLKLQSDSTQVMHCPCHVDLKPMWFMVVYNGDWHLAGPHFDLTTGT